ncbi:hypothetical protein Agub_g8614 [Astrephomene gubernaculifera]|uniref:BTB domain-containing protein n=1 Tax=Astrephomene gubernaculifera TaxID=47775 RepID=A0AAD3DUN1_9CHLO|nr:hypothetical protein Agub_g8614 [Astrephomene gubernaculifera]
MSEEQDRKRPRPIPDDEEKAQQVGSGVNLGGTNPSAQLQGEGPVTTDIPATSTLLTAASPLQLLLRDGVLLDSNACVLSQASSVLRETLRLPLSQPGVLELREDDPQAWSAALQMISLQVYPMDVVNWDNVERLLVLADKYDMTLVRHTCADFLARKSSVGELSMNQPLTSPRNPLRAVSLVDSYCSGIASLQTLHTAVHKALDTALAPLTVPLLKSKQTCADVVRLLGELETGLTSTGGDSCFAGISPSVQAAVMRGLITSLRGVAAAAPICHVCNSAVGRCEPLVHRSCLNLSVSAGIPIRR